MCDGSPLSKAIWRGLFQVILHHWWNTEVGPKQRTWGMLFTGFLSLILVYMPGSLLRGSSTDMDRTLPYQSLGKWLTCLLTDQSYRGIFSTVVPSSQTSRFLSSWQKAGTSPNSVSSIIQKRARDCSLLSFFEERGVGVKAGSHYVLQVDLEPSSEIIDIPHPYPTGFW